MLATNSDILIANKVSTIEGYRTRKYQTNNKSTIKNLRRSSPLINGCFQFSTVSHQHRSVVVHFILNCFLTKPKIFIVSKLSYFEMIKTYPCSSRISANSAHFSSIFLFFSWSNISLFGCRFDATSNAASSSSVR